MSSRPGFTSGLSSELVSQVQVPTQMNFAAAHTMADKLLEPEFSDYLEGATEYMVRSTSSFIFCPFSTGVTSDSRWRCIKEIMS